MIGCPSWSDQGGVPRHLIYFFMLARKFSMAKKSSRMVETIKDCIARFPIPVLGTIPVVSIPYHIDTRYKWGVGFEPTKLACQKKLFFWFFI